MTNADKVKLYARLDNKSDLPAKLSVALGAPVIITKNLSHIKHAKVVNGTTGTVLGFTDTHIEILLDTPLGNGQVAKIGKERDVVSCPGAMITRHMFPINLAFARTAYKVQGRTIKTQLVVFADTLPKPGESYVAFSRVTSVENLVVVLHDPANIEVTAAMFKPHNPQ